MDHYSYDRTASEKTWYDIKSEAEEVFITKAGKELAQELGGTSKGGIAPEVTYDGGKVTMGFMGGSAGMVYVLSGPKKKRTEHSVVNHTPSSFATFLVNSLKLKA